MTVKVFAPSLDYTGRDKIPARKVVAYCPACDLTFNAGELHGCFACERCRTLCELHDYREWKKKEVKG